jgi:hypothetical protein
VTKVLPPGMVLGTLESQEFAWETDEDQTLPDRMDLIRLLAIARWCRGIAYLLLGY